MLYNEDTRQLMVSRRRKQVSIVEYQLLSSEQIKKLAERLADDDMVVIRSGGPMACLTVVHDHKGSPLYWYDNLNDWAEQ